MHVITKTISHIKKKIEKREDIPYVHQVLIYGGQKLEESKSLNDYNIPDFGELELVQSGQLYTVVVIVTQRQRKQIIISPSYLKLTKLH